MQFINITLNKTIQAQAIKKNYLLQEGSFHAEDKLMFAQVPILKESSCLKPYGRAEFSRQTMVCAGYLQGLIDSCQARSIKKRVSESLQNSYFCQKCLILPWGQSWERFFPQVHSS